MGKGTNKPREIEAIEEVTTNEEGFIEGTTLMGVEEFNQNVRQKLEIPEKEVKKRTKGPRNEIYLLKAFKAYMQRLEEAKMLTPEEKEVLTKVHKQMTERWIGLTL